MSAVINLGDLMHLKHERTDLLQGQTGINTKFSLWPQPFKIYYTEHYKYLMHGVEGLSSICLCTET
jgi:hypothetical protein